MPTRTCGCPSHHCTVGQFFSANKKCLFKILTIALALQFLCVRPGYICIGLYLGDGYVKLNAEVLFRYRINIIFTKDLMFKIVKIFTILLLYSRFYGVI